MGLQQMYQPSNMPEYRKVIYFSVLLLVTVKVHHNPDSNDSNIQKIIQLGREHHQLFQASIQLSLLH